MPQFTRSRLVWRLAAFLAILVGLGLLVVSQSRIARHCARIAMGNPEAAIADAKQDIAFLQEFEAMFPESLIFITYYTGLKGQESMNVKVGLHGRYVLSIKFDISMNWTGRRIKSHGPPSFYFVEVASIKRLPAGNWSIAYGGNQHRFDLDSWLKVVENDGDLSVLGVEYDPSRPPIENFDEVRGAW